MEAKADGEIDPPEELLLPPPPDDVVTVFVVQVTETLVTLPPDTVPEPLPTEQVCPEGLDDIVTPYGLPLAMLVAKVKEPLEEMERLSPPLSSRTRVPERPDTVPPMV